MINEVTYLTEHVNVLKIENSVKPGDLPYALQPPFHAAGSKAPFSAIIPDAR